MSERRALPSVEEVARVLFDTYHAGRNPNDLDLIWRLMNVGESGWMTQAAAVLALFEDTGVMHQARCGSTITLRDEEHRLVRCALDDGHREFHTDRRGCQWTD